MTEQKRHLCISCLRAKNACFCSVIYPFIAPFELVILMHPKEAKNTVGTGRLTFKSFKNAHLIKGVDFTNNIQVNTLLADPKYSPLILYPGKNSLILNRHTKSEISEVIPSPKIPLIFVIDGTWPTAKTMMRTSQNLHALPRISFDHDQESEFLFKLQPHKLCLSTVESVYKVLEIFEEKKLGICDPSNGKDKMLDAFHWLVQYQFNAAKDPNRQSYRPTPPKDVKTIEKPKSYEKRNLFFN